ncbi:MAG: hypothetical protein ABFS17_12675 [Chloroflexota bacterium]
MPEKQNAGSAAWVRWLLLGLIFLAQLLVLAIAPEEKTIGTGIKPVYFHVSLTWTGMLMLAAAVIFGIGVLLSANQKLTVWQARVLNSGFVLYIFGFLVSMYASVINWGGVPFNEPPVRQAINFMLAGIVLWGSSWWFNTSRMKALLGVLAAGMLLLATESSQSILHPESPVNSSPLSIKTTFYIMFGLGLLLAAWTIHYQKQINQNKLVEQK